MQHQRLIQSNNSRRYRPIVLVSARILNCEPSGNYVSNTGRFTIVIFLSDNGRLVFSNSSASINVEAKIGTTVLIGNTEKEQTMSWTAPNKLLEIAIEDRFVSDVIAAVTPSKTALSDVIGVYGPEAGFGALAKRLACKMLGNQKTSASLVADGYYCAPTARFLIAMMVNIRNNINQDKSNKKRLSLPENILKEIVDHIENEISTAISVSEMAEIAAQSRFHFARTFRASTGSSPHSYILDSRIRRAEFLLSETNVSLSQIANDSGFNSQSHFTTTFKKRIGLTPGKYRDLHR
ncbi:helix-turn-helix domain-containing protein [Pseudomonas agarici]|uniref:helix-turn-helix domain-containing protein n=1 Tax=Pseudomonas agarici TaxID=46677 RepID=UPI0008C02F67|nr:AraC family transcriptional regulator [Pseudomonas agarici]SEK29829.1 AraC-type DNA-binding protein [Pseudomonas agarici]